MNDGGRRGRTEHNDPEAPSELFDLDRFAPRVKVALVLGYLAVIALAVFLPLTWGSRAMLDHVYLVAASVSALWFGAAWLMSERLDLRWPRRTTTVTPTASEVREDAASAVGKVRRSGWRWRTWLTLRWALAVPTAVAIVVGLGNDSAHDAAIARDQPTTTATVVAVDRSIPTRSGLPDSVTVDLHGSRVDLYGDLPDVKVGDLRTVVVDPSDPKRVLDVETHTGGMYSPLGIWGLALAFGIIPLGAVLLVSRPRAAAWALSRANRAELAKVRLLPDGTVQVSTSLGEFRWTGRDWPEEVQSGTCWAVGSLAEGSWVGLVRDGDVEWPDDPLRVPGRR